MRKIIQVIAILLFVLSCHGQVNCETEFTNDTLYLPATGQILEGQALHTVLKDQTRVKLFKTTNNHYYLKLFVTRNFYFNKVGVLELRSGSKSYYAKDIIQYKIDKSTGMYVFEILRNYVGTLRDEGITSIVFSKTETDFTKRDVAQVRQIGLCFYESIAGKK